MSTGAGPDETGETLRGGGVSGAGEGTSGERPVLRCTLMLATQTEPEVGGTEDAILTARPVWNALARGTRGQMKPRAGRPKIH